MTVKEQIARLVDGLDDDSAEHALVYIEDLARSPVPGKRPLPAFVGSGHSGRRDTSERVDEFLAEGFGK